MNITDKKFLITGGTGSFGSTVCDFLLKENVSEIRIFSRDEKKQNDMREKISDSRVQFFLEMLEIMKLFYMLQKVQIIFSMQLLLSRYHLVNFIQLKQ